jgi:type I restriction enzyme S subunit
MSTVALKNYPSATFNGFTKRLRPKDPYLISPTFAGYYFRSPLFRAKVTSYAIMTTRASLNNEILSRLTISLPPIEIQDSIGEVLKSLDDKIELNNKINQELETLAQTLFKRWFIDFEFPNKNGEPYKSSGGEMVESELGEIPKGWRVNKLNEVADCFDNKRIPLSSMERSIRKGDYPYYGAASLMDYIDDYLFDGIYLLMGEDGSVTDINGYPILQYVFGKFWVNNHAHVLKGRIISTELVMCLLRNTNIGDLVTGAVQPKLNQGNMNKISIPLPEDLKTITTIENLITEYYNLVRNNILEINELTNLRDTLLPKLISGELEINEISN